MKKDLLRKSFQKGLISAFVLIFIVLIDFEIMAASIISKIMGVTVSNDALPDVQYMETFLILLGLAVGWSAARNSEKFLDKMLNGFIASLSMGVCIALFDLILVYLLKFDIDIRDYLAALSQDSMKLFLLNYGEKGPLAHLIYFSISGLIGGLIASVIQSPLIVKTVQSVKSTISGFNNKVSEKTPSATKKYLKYLIYAVIGVIFLILPSKWGSYNNYVFGLVGLYVILGIGLNIIVGLSGQLVLGFAAFFAMGAYSVALLNAPEPHGIMLGFWPSIIIGILASIIAAVLLGLPITGLRGDYLAIVTMGFGEIIRILLKSDLLTDYTGGPRGVQDIRGPTLFGKPFTSDVDYAYLIIVGVVLSIFLYNRLENSRTGRAWLALKEDTIVAQATGVNIQKYKLLALCIGAAFAGLAGGIFAARNQFTGPNDHSFTVSINILSLVIVGGMNSIPGIILGAFTLKGLPEILREIENYRLLVFGALLIFMMLVRPEGLWPASRPLLERQHKDTLQNNSPDKGERNG